MMHGDAATPTEGGAPSRTGEPGTAGETLLNRVLGSRLDPDLADRLHHVSHHSRIELLRLEPRDVHRRRLRTTTDTGRACMIALGREEKLYDGAVLLLEPHRAIVVRVTDETWLRLRPASPADALELGHAAGHLHWRVRFAGADLEVAIEGPREGYLTRIPQLLKAGRVAIVEDGS